MYYSYTSHESVTVTVTGREQHTEYALSCATTRLYLFVYSRSLSSIPDHAAEIMKMNRMFKSESPIWGSFDDKAI